MRTLILNKFLHRNGGSETYIFKLGEALEQHGHEVQYFGMEHEGRCVSSFSFAELVITDSFHGTVFSLKNQKQIVLCGRKDKESKIRSLLDQLDIKISIYDGESIDKYLVKNTIDYAGFRWGAYGMFLATLLAKASTCVYLFCAMKAWNYFSIKAYNSEMFKSVFKYSMPLVPNQLSWWVVGASDRTIVSHFISVFENGIYSVANKFSTIYVTFYNIFNLSWTESVSLHMNDGDRDDFLTDIINTMFNLFAAVDVGIIACMPFVFGLMVNDKYGAAYYQIPILMIAVLFQVVVGLYSVIYVALKKSTEIAKTSFLAAIINIGVDLLLINYIGLYAASISTLVAYAAMAIYRYIDVRKYVSVRLSCKNVCAAAFSVLVSVFAYYTKNMIVCSVSLIYIILYAVIFNRTFLCSFMQELKLKLFKK